MKDLYDQLKKTPVVYVTRDIERALGLPQHTEGYVIITNNTPFAKKIAATRNNIIRIEHNEPLDTRELLQHPQTIEYLQSLTNPNVLVFKNTKQIESICKRHGWNLLNPEAALVDKVELKISQIAWLADLSHFLRDYDVVTCKEIEWHGKPIVIQFNRSHTGSGTLSISSKQELKTLQQKFPDRMARVTDFIKGPLFTNNNCVAADDILIGNISYQITGLKPFTDRRFATIGNDWKLPTTLLTDKQRKKYVTIAKEIGKKLQQDGWRGLFGIDCIVDQKTGELFLLEINARQPASTTFEAELQKSKNKDSRLNTITTFEAHISTLLGISTNSYQLTTITDGAQIIYRNKTKSSILPAGRHSFNLQSSATELEKEGFNTISYNNTAPGSDLLRIQSKEGMMKNHNEFNKVGKKILNVLSS